MGYLSGAVYAFLKRKQSYWMCCLNYSQMGERNLIWNCICMTNAQENTFFDEVPQYVFMRACSAPSTLKLDHEFFNLMRYGPLHMVPLEWCGNRQANLPAIHSKWRHGVNTGIFRECHWLVENLWNDTQALSDKITTFFSPLLVPNKLCLVEN